MQYDWTWGTTGHTQPKVVVSNATLPWWVSSCIKNKDIYWFTPDILLIKESSNLIGREAHLAASNQSGSFRYYLTWFPKILRHQLKPSTDLVDQRI